MTEISLAALADRIDEQAGELAARVGAALRDDRGAITRDLERLCTVIDRHEGGDARTALMVSLLTAYVLALADDADPDAAAGLARALGELAARSVESGAGVVNVDTLDPAESYALTDADREQLAHLAARAAVRPIPFDTLAGDAVALMRGRQAPSEDAYAELVRRMGPLTVVFAHEEQRPGLVCRHLGVAHVTRPTVRVEEVGALMAALGFINPLGRLACWPEPVASPDETKLCVSWQSIHVCEPLDGDMSRLMVADAPPEGATIN